MTDMYTPARIEETAAQQLAMLEESGHATVVLRAVYHLIEALARENRRQTEAIGLLEIELERLRERLARLDPDAIRAP